jgi:ribosomal protein S18 acetylase RimI-like enzyme
MTQARIVRVDVSDWMTYRSMRLSALQDAPDAFASLYEDQTGYTDDQWQRRLASASPATDYPVLAMIGDEPAGMAWAVVEPAEQPVGKIFQMWVKPEHRGLGIGRLILLDLLNWLKSKSALSAFLGVTCGNSPAKLLYESCGFLPVGDPEPLREGSELLAQEMRVVL